MEGQVADCGRVTLWGSPWPPSGREGLGQGLHVIVKSFHMPAVLYSKFLIGEGGVSNIPQSTDKLRAMLLINISKNINISQYHKMFALLMLPDITIPQDVCPADDADAIYLCSIVQHHMMERLVEGLDVR